MNIRIIFTPAEFQSNFVDRRGPDTSSFSLFVGPIADSLFLEEKESNQHVGASTSDNPKGLQGL
jgi:hypothetical protein